MIIDAESGSSVYAVLHGDMHIRNGHPVYQVLPFPLQARDIPVDEARQQPSQLLAAEGRVVAFAGRHGELAELSAWRDDSAPGVSVMLLHAPGGQGKTRLAAQFATDSAANGWTAWAAHHLSDPTNEHVVVPGEAGPTLVLIVDYAERWPLDDLLLLLRNPLLRRPERARVLLVARQADRWWPSLRHRMGKSDIDVGPTMALPPLAETLPERQETFTTARDAFLAALGVPRASGPVPDNLADDAFRLILTLHMAALVDAHCGGTPTSDPARLSAYLLDREHDFWHSLHDHGQVATGPRLMGRTVYTAMMTRALHRRQATAALARIGVADIDAAAGIVDDHTMCYPPTTPGTVLEPLYPDRLAEDFLALSLPGHSCADHIPDEWTTDAPSRLVTTEYGARPHVRSTLTALIETARRWSHVAERQLYPMLRADPMLSVEAGGAALNGLVSLENLDLGVAEAVEACLPEHAPMDLAPGAAALSRLLTRHRLEQSRDMHQRARLHEDLGMRLADASLWDEAAVSFDLAVQIRRQLAPKLLLRKRRLGNNEIALAHSLGNLGSALQQLGRRAEAVATNQATLDLYDRLARSGVDIPETGLAMALNNTGQTLSELGRFEESEKYLSRAVDTYRRLTEAGSPKINTELPGALDNLGMLLWQMGRCHDALPYIREAVTRYHELAQAQPGRFEYDLAIALRSLSMALAGLGERDAALTEVQRATEIAKQLAKANATAFEPLHAATLSSLALRLAQVGRLEEALPTAEHAAQIRRRLAEDNPAAFEQYLAESVGNIGVILSDLGRHEDSLPYTQEATGLYRRLCTADPTAFRLRLAVCLGNLGAQLMELERWTEALPYVTEAVDHSRELHAANPTAFRPQLIMQLANLGTQHTALEHWTEALSYTAEAVALCGELADTAGEEQVAGACCAFAWARLSARRNINDAYIAADTAIQVYVKLARSQPQAFANNVVKAYLLMAEILDALGRVDEAANIRRQLQQTIQTQQHNADDHP